MMMNSSCCDWEGWIWVTDGWELATMSRKEGRSGGLVAIFGVCRVDVKCIFRAVTVGIGR